VIFSYYLRESLAWRILIAILVLAPLGVVLGTFFPLGIRVVERADRRLVPWAWGINGLASVVGTICSVMLAMAYGFTAVMVIATAIYVVGAVGLASRMHAS